MKESYGEDVAGHAGPESCVAVGNGRGEALTGVRAGPVSSLEKVFVRGADALFHVGRQYPSHRFGEMERGPSWSETWCMYGNTSRENREIPCPPGGDGSSGRGGKPSA